MSSLGNVWVERRETDRWDHMPFCMVLDHLHLHLQLELTILGARHFAIIMMMMHYLWLDNQGPIVIKQVPYYHISNLYHIIQVVWYQLVDAISISCTEHKCDTCQTIGQ
jgi:hypothetical protein